MRQLFSYFTRQENVYRTYCASHYDLIVTRLSGKRRCGVFYKNPIARIHGNGAFDESLKNRIAISLGKHSSRSLFRDAFTIQATAAGAKINVRCLRFGQATAPIFADKYWASGMQRGPEFVEQGNWNATRETVGECHGETYIRPFVSQSIQNHVNSADAGPFVVGCDCV